VPKTARSLGILIASALKGAWRSSAPAPALSPDQLAEITPAILHGGAGALLWWHIRNSSLSNSEAGAELQQAYLLHTLEAAVHEREVQQATDFLRSRNLEPILAKGCAVARLYPEPGLRPFGDFDLYVRPEDHARAVAILAGPGAPQLSLDMHAGFKELDDRSFDELYARSQLVALAGVNVRMPGPEDHLRLLSLHTLRHGAWRPIWLCDIAVVFEHAAPAFDWEYFLSGDVRRTDWVVCALGLAHELLDMNADTTRLRSRMSSLPYWLVPEVLRQWATPMVPQGRRLPMEHFLRDPKGVVSALRERWPNGIEATVDVGGPFNYLPRLPFQLADCAYRIFKFLSGPSSR
jgi:hypothetical protein